MANFYGATALTGGGTGALDGIDGASLADGDGAFAVVAGKAYIYRLDATSGAAESSPEIIAPDANGGTKRWLLVAAVFDGTVTFAQEIDNGDSGAADTIDWTAGNKQKSTLTAVCTFTFSPEPAGPCNLILKLVQGGTGSYTVTWPADVKWPGGTAPTLSTAVGAVDLISFYYDGTDFYGQAALDMQ